MAVAVRAAAASALVGGRMNAKPVAIGGLLGAVLLSAAAIIKPWEGYKPQPYIDAVGVLTVCYGHTGRSTGTAVERKTHTQAECDALLEADMLEAWRHVERCITAPMTTWQGAALLSAASNIGPSVVCGSKLQKKANAGDWVGACAELDRWTYAGGKQLRGLVNRRAEERKVCEGRL